MFLSKYIKHNLLKNTISLVLTQAIRYLSPLIVFPYLTRVMGISGFGKYTVILSFCAICKILTDYGSSISATCFISKNKENKKNVSKYISTILASKCLLFLITALIAIIYMNESVFAGDAELLFFVFLLLFSQIFQFDWFFSGIERMKNITYTAIMSNVVYVFLILIFVRSSNDLPLVILSLTISNFIIGFVSIMLIYKEGFFLCRPQLLDVFRVITSDFTYFLSRASVGIYTSASTFLIGNFSGFNEAAIYSCAEKLYNVCRTMIAPLSQAFFPYITRTKNYKIYIKFTLFFLFLVVIISVLISFFINDIINLLFGSNYLQAIKICQIFMFGVVISYISVMVGYPLFSLIERLDLANYSVMFSAAFQVILLIVLWKLNQLTALHVAVGVITAELLSIIIRIRLFFAASRCKNNPSDKC